MLVGPLLNVQILARGSFPTVETKPVFFFFFVVVLFSAEFVQMMTSK